MLDHDADILQVTTACRVTDGGVGGKGRDKSKRNTDIL